ncbi:MAG: hypothetical protein ACI9F9_001753 [Candidatus Paceibacteria bacterium]|jgi:hypothetical protein
MNRTRKCSHCAAPALDSESRFCSYCGSELPRSEERPTVSASPHETLAQRFKALDAHHGLDQMLQHQPRSSSVASGMYAQSIGGLLFTGIAIGVSFLFFTVAPPLAFIPLIIVAIGLWITIGGLQRSANFRAAPLRRFSAALIDERVKVSGGGSNSSASTSYFATLQVPGGGRTEYQVSEDIASRVAPGDIGLAFAKDTVLLDFLVVPV